ncbi:group II intron maturase-specific domain-containing protein [Rhodococcus pyridinivorans]
MGRPRQFLRARGAPQTRRRHLSPGRGGRLSGVPHPAASQEGHEQDECLHLSVEEGVAFDHGQGAGADEEARHHGLADLLGRLNPVLRGWCAYFHPRCVESNLRLFRCLRLASGTRWLLKLHKRITWADLYRRFLTSRPGNRPQENGIVMFDTTTVAVTRYRWRASNIPTPWSNSGTSVPA